MDKSFNELEAELKGLIPRQVNPALMARVANDLASSATILTNAEEDSGTIVNHFLSWRWLTVGAVGFAAAVVLLIAMIRFSKSEKAIGSSATGTAMDLKGLPPHYGSMERLSVTDTYRPVSAANVLYEMKDEGPVTAQGDTSERRVRYRYVDTYTWKNPRNNASLTWRVPRDEIRVQPAQFN